MSITLTLNSSVTPDDFTLSTRALDMFLVDRRTKIPKALQHFGITAAQSSDLSALSAASIDELMALPSSPLEKLNSDQLVRAAQLVDTALFRLYLISKPIFIGSLCRIDNWCEVAEVEEALKGRKVCVHECFQPMILTFGLEICRAH